MRVTIEMDMWAAELAAAIPKGAVVRVDHDVDDLCDGVCPAATAVMRSLRDRERAGEVAVRFADGFRVGGNATVRRAVYYRPNFEDYLQYVVRGEMYPEDCGTPAMLDDTSS